MIYREIAEREALLLNNLCVIVDNNIYHFL